MINKLKGLKAGITFFELILLICKVIGFVFIVCSLLFFWVIVLAYYAPYKELAIFMLKLLSMVVSGIVVSGIFILMLKLLYNFEYRNKFDNGITKLKSLRKKKNG